MLMRDGDAEFLHEQFGELQASSWALLEADAQIDFVVFQERDERWRPSLFAEEYGHVRKPRFEIAQDGRQEVCGDGRNRPDSDVAERAAVDLRHFDAGLAHRP